MRSSTEPLSFASSAAVSTGIFSGMSDAMAVHFDSVLLAMQMPVKVSLNCAHFLAMTLPTPPAPMINTLLIFLFLLLGSWLVIICGE